MPDTITHLVKTQTLVYMVLQRKETKGKVELKKW